MEDELRPPKRRKITEEDQEAENVKCDDISGGLEPFPIPCKNYNGPNSCLESFEKYIISCISATPLEEEDADCDYDGCECKSSCHAPINEPSCSCFHRFGLFYYDESERLRQLSSAQTNVECLIETKTKSNLANLTCPIFECNSACTCTASCGNRVVQRGIKCSLEVKSTLNKGWGVFARECLPSGRFVGEYVGELISTKDARRRHAEYAERYILVLHEHFESTQQSLRTNIDATKYGNFARFFNHSCEPNIHVVPVRVNSFVPRVAFFTTRTVEAGEELCFDYGSLRVPSDGRAITPPQERRACHCESKACKGFLPYDALV